MRYLTEQDRKVAEAARARHEAHHKGDLAAYTEAARAEEAARNEMKVYCCPCGKRWDGSGRLIICYVTMVEVAHERDGSGTIIHEVHSRGDEHHIYWCPECAPAIKAHLGR